MLEQQGSKKKGCEVRTWKYLTVEYLKCVILAFIHYSSTMMMALHLARQVGSHGGFWQLIGT